MISYLCKFPIASGILVLGFRAQRGRRHLVTWLLLRAICPDAPAPCPTLESRAEIYACVRHRFRIGPFFDPFFAFAGCADIRLVTQDRGLVSSSVRNDSSGRRYDKTLAAVHRSNLLYRNFSRFLIGIFSTGRTIFVRG